VLRAASEGAPAVKRVRLIDRVRFIADAFCDVEEAVDNLTAAQHPGDKRRARARLKVVAAAYGLALQRYVGGRS
jgi:hypothetical protein